MARVLFAVTGSRHWTLNDGTQHRCGYWPEELAVPHEVFAHAHIDVDIATPGAVVPVPDEAGFSAEMNGGSEEPGARFRAYLKTISDDLDNPVDLNQVDPDDYDLVFVPGGHGPMEDLAASEAFGRLVVAFTEQHKPVSAVCHGPAALLPAVDEDGWIFRGRRVTGFSNTEEEQVGLADKAPWLLEDRLRSAGGEFEQGPGPWQEYVVVDGNLYTGQNPASSRPLAQLLVSAVSSARV
ncbi:type 1 glutamine amidotransferase domain-containing protein [Nocardioides pyridinolyticus]